MAATIHNPNSSELAAPLPLEPPRPRVHSYMKRFRMDIDLLSLPPVPTLPPNFAFAAWDDNVSDDHADALFESFRDEVDAVVFSSLSSRNGCKYLMRDIAGRRGFIPEATWLISWQHPQATDHWSPATDHWPCGTVQGVRTLAGTGAIQNLGIVPEHRGRGLGTALLLKALWGFARVGIRKAYLEVTASNTGAINLYRSLGFHKTRALYKAILPPDVVVVESA